MESKNLNRTIYEDERGWKYMVMQGLGENNWKARYQKPGKSGWKCCVALPWRKTPEDAQADLDIMAERKNWKRIE